jgi:hypothetical protein
MASRNSRPRPLQIHPLYAPLPLMRLPHQIPKVLPRNLALRPHLPHLLLLLLQALHITLERDVQVRGREPEYFSCFGDDARGVRVHVVKLGEGGGEFAREAGGEGRGD